MGKVSFDFQVFAKPAGPLCNLNCKYCYYLNKQTLYPGAGQFRMSESLLERYIIQHVEASPEPVVAFSWHGGEPTVLGLDYFRKVVELQRKHTPAGRRIENGIQTNGVLVDEDWSRFLAEERFSVGLSMDGPAELHDAYRVSSGGQPTHRRVMRAFGLLTKHNVPTSIICVVHNINVAQPLTVYRFFREIGCRYLGFLPVVERDPATGGLTPETPSAEAYGAFLCRIFDEWIVRDTARMTVQMFDEASRPIRGMEHSLCVFRETCGQIPVLEHNGDLFPCDHYVATEFRLGNIDATPLPELLECPAQRAFGEAKKSALPRYCAECDVLQFCNGGCPKYRFIATPEGEPSLNYLCAGLKRFFRHCQEPLRRLLLPQAEGAPGRSAPPRPATAAAPGRNDPCPCGSGRKYKKCCAGA